MSKQNSAVERKGISTPETVSQAHQGGNTPVPCLAADAFIETGYRRFSKAMHHVADTATGPCFGPFVRLAEDSAVAFRGIEAALSLIEASDVRATAMDDGAENVAPVLNVVDRDALLANAALTARLMGDKIDELAEWADEQCLRGQK